MDAKRTLCLVPAIVLVSPGLAQDAFNDRRLMLPNTTFVPQPTTPGYALDILMVDIDRDGRDEALVVSPTGIDVWGVDPTDHSRWVLESSIDLGHPVWGVCVADFDHDGRLDIACGPAPESVEGWRAVRLLMGTTNGFAESPGFEHSGPVIDLDAGDFNGDGILDLIVFPNAVYPGLGGGAFGAGVEIDELMLGSGLRIVDLNGDGLDDFVTSAVTRTGVHVGLATGAFAFDVCWIDNGHAATSEVAVGDFNGDGAPDLAVLACDEADPFEALVRVFQNAGDGTFFDLPPLALGFRPTVITRLDAGDFDGDGFDDIAAVVERSREEPRTVLSVLYGSASGAMYDERVLSDHATPGSLVRCGEVTGDGRADLITLSFPIVGAALGLFRNTGDRTFDAPRPASGSDEPDADGPVTFDTPTVAADVTGDGRDDLIRGRTALSVYENRNRGQITAQDLIASFDFGVEILAHAAADLNGDGVADLIVATDGAETLRVIISLGDGAFLPPAPLPIPSGRVLRLADVDASGTVDIVVSHQSFVTSPAVVVALGHGDGTFGEAAFSFVSTELDENNIELIDVTGDGLLDLVGISPENKLIRFASTEPGRFSTGSSFIDLTTTICPKNIIPGDYDGDGFTDLVYNRTSVSGEIVTALRFSNGDGTFAPAYILRRLPTVILRASADINGDGMDDLLGTRGEAAYSNGEGGFDVTPPAIAGYCTDGRFADFNGDGVVDLYDDTGRLLLNTATDAGACPGDCDGTGEINFNDLIGILFAFGDPEPTGACDPNATGAVDFNDLVAALFMFGACP
ncbi:MAG: VCBS repeat-containing protein [Phycisphaerales bacterium]